MGRSQILSQGIFSVLLLGTLGLAQERPNGFFLSSPLSLSAGYDDNFEANSKVLDDKVLILTGPAFSWIKSTHRARFSVDYQPEFEMFSRYQDLNAWNHSATLRYGYRLTPRLSADVGNSYLSTSDASRQLAQSQFLLPRGRYQQNSFFAGLKYRLSQRTTVLARFDNAITALAKPGPEFNLSNQMASAGTVTVDHNVNRRHSVTGSYAYVYVRPFDKILAGYSYHTVHSLTSGYMYTGRAGFVFRVAGGVIRGREFAYTGGGAVEKQLGGVWIMAGYQRYLAFLGGLAGSGGITGVPTPASNNLLPDSLFQALSLRVRGKVTRRIGLEFNGQRGRTSLGDRGIRSVIAQSRLDYRLSERFTSFVRVDYYGQNLSPFSETPLSRRRYVAGLEITLSRPPEREGANRRHRGGAAESVKPQEEEK